MTLNAVIHVATSRTAHRALKVVDLATPAFSLAAPPSFCRGGGGGAALFEAFRKAFDIPGHGTPWVGGYIP